jgi:hypothetical protein
LKLTNPGGFEKILKMLTSQITRLGLSLCKQKSFKNLLNLTKTTVVSRGHNLSRFYLHTSASLQNAKRPSDEDATTKKQDDSNAGLRLSRIYLFTPRSFFFSFSADDPITTYLSSKYKILSEENAPIILDLEAERKRLDELDISQDEEQTNNTRFEDNQFADIDLTRKNTIKILN